ITVDPGWNRWDLEIFRGIWSKAHVTVAAENHGGGERLLNVRSEIRLTRVSQLSLGVFAGLVAVGGFFAIPEGVAGGTALGLVTLGVIVSENLRLARILNDTYDIVAAGLGVRPINGGTASAAPEAAWAGRRAWAARCASWGRCCVGCGRTAGPSPSPSSRSC